VTRLRRASGRQRLGPNRCWLLTAAQLYGASKFSARRGKAINDAFGVHRYIIFPVCSAKFRALQLPMIPTPASVIEAQQEASLAHPGLVPSGDVYGEVRHAYFDALA